MRRPRVLSCPTSRPSTDNPEGGNPESVPCAVPAPAPALRRRGAALEHAIFDAVLDQLNSVGFAGLTMEGVAASAHTGKAALYRRWPSKEDLVVDALKHFLPSFDGPPDTGNLRDDLAQVLRAMLAILNGKTGHALLGLIGELARDHDFVKTVHSRVLGPRKAIMAVVLERAVARGEINPDADPLVNQLVAETAPALIIHRLFCDGPPIEPAFADAVLDHVVMPLLAAKETPAKVRRART